MNVTDLETLETKLLLEAVYKRYGYDFRNYAIASIKRRIRNFLSKSPYSRPSEVIPHILVNKRLMADLVFHISVPVTEMFRDPAVFKTLRAKVLPDLATYPFIKIWVAGCATGEEVYSIAILIKEAELSRRCQIYATDFNDAVLRKAREGIYPVDNIKICSENYLASGGRFTLSNYYHAKYKSVIMDQDLKRNIVFANHNLATDASFGETHLILCRNVMIYFDRELQNRTIKLFYDSLIYRGFLCLGTKENIQFTDCADRFAAIDKGAKIYQKRMP